MLRDLLAVFQFNRAVRRDEANAPSEPLEVQFARMMASPVVHRLVPDRRAKITVRPLEPETLTKLTACDDTDPLPSV